MNRVSIQEVPHRIDSMAMNSMLLILGMNLLIVRETHPEGLKEVLLSEQQIGTLIDNYWCWSGCLKVEGVSGNEALKCMDSMGMFKRSGITNLSLDEVRSAIPPSLNRLVQQSKAGEYARG